jgi:predicted nuclease of restriction endonuclease-like (RecB) superfamily
VTPLVTQISWTNHLLIMAKSKTKEERDFYIHLSVKERYSSRELERQLDSAYYERYMLSTEKLEPVPVKKKIKNTFLDPYVLEFLDLPDKTLLQEKLRELTEIAETEEAEE